MPPAFALTTSDGQHVSLSSYHGKVLVLNFWATWCPPCVEEVPSLNALQKQLASRNVEVLGVSIDKDAGAYRKFLTDYHIAFATALDPSAAIAHSYRTFKVPETYVINRNGIVARKIVGETDWTSSEMVDYLTDLARGS